MKRVLRILLLAVLFTGVSMQDKICDHLNIGPSFNMASSPKETRKVTSSPKDYFLSDSIYIWDETQFDWTNTGKTKDSEFGTDNISIENSSIGDPIEIDWKVLLDIEYKLRYFSELDMEIYAPVFSSALKHLHKKEVIIEGFVIPFYAEEEIISLSQNPFASCFFCGKASPASVISLYLKDTDKRYKMDDFRKFRGTLYLNYDDPNEFYYILRDAQEE